MGNRKSSGDLHVGDIVVYDGKQRMRVAGFPTTSMVVLVTLVLIPDYPSTVKTSVTDKKIAKVSSVVSDRRGEKER
jgi:hypothetical protein